MLHKNKNKKGQHKIPNLKTKKIRKKKFGEYILPWLGSIRLSVIL